MTVLLALAGCRPAPKAAGSNAPSSAPLSEVSRYEWSGVDIPAGRIDDAVSKVDGLVSDLMKNTGIPGMAVAIVHSGKTLYAKGFGVKDTSKGDAADNKVDADTVFQMASISKFVGATVVAHEVTDSVVSWDTPVVSKLPWFALSDPYVSSNVTIGDLYSHRSGLPDYAGVGRGGEVLGGPVRRGALPPSRDGVDKFAVRRFPGPAQSRRRPRQGGGQMGTAL
jgi:CubicO group peptidase (beta-lactamase class C family)